jgi:hypothetical protein
MIYHRQIFCSNLQVYARALPRRGADHVQIHPNHRTCVMLNVHRIYCPRLLMLMKLFWKHPKG